MPTTLPGATQRSTAALAADLRRARTCSAAGVGAGASGGTRGRRRAAQWRARRRQMQSPAACASRQPRPSDRPGGAGCAPPRLTFSSQPRRRPATPPPGTRAERPRAAAAARARACAGACAGVVGPSLDLLAHSSHRSHRLHCQRLPRVRRQAGGGSKSPASTGMPAAEQQPSQCHKHTPRCGRRSPAAAERGLRLVERGLHWWGPPGRSAGCSSDRCGGACESHGNGGFQVGAPPSALHAMRPAVGARALRCRRATAEQRPPGRAAC